MSNPRSRWTDQPPPMKRSRPENYYDDNYPPRSSLPIPSHLPSNPPPFKPSGLNYAQNIHIDLLIHFIHEELLRNNQDPSIAIELATRASQTTPFLALFNGIITNLPSKQTPVVGASLTAIAECFAKEIFGRNRNEAPVPLASNPHPAFPSQHAAPYYSPPVATSGSRFGPALTNPEPSLSSVPARTAPRHEIPSSYPPPLSETPEWNAPPGMSPTVVATTIPPSLTKPSSTILHSTFSPSSLPSALPEEMQGKLPSPLKREDHFREMAPSFDDLGLGEERRMEGEERRGEEKRGEGRGEERKEEREEKEEAVGEVEGRGANLLDEFSEQILFNRGDVIWKGIISRNDKKKVRIQAQFLSGDVSHFFNPSLSAIDFSQRIPYDKIGNVVPYAVAVLRADGEDTNNKKTFFTEYIEYLGSKQRSGVFSLNDTHVFLLAEGEVFDKYEKFNFGESDEDKYLLALLVRQ